MDVISEKDLLNEEPTSSTGDTAGYPAGLPPRPEGNDQASRVRPAYNACMPTTTLSSYSLRTGSDRELRFRRILMIIILALRFAGTVCLIVFDGIFGYPGRLLVDIIVGLFMFVLVAHWLHLIGSVTGTRKVLGMYVTRRPYDVFLCVMIVLHLGLIAMSVVATSCHVNAVGTAVDCLIFLVAWITTWAPTPATLRA